ncbi:hypothetical protein HDU76_010140, partial [Blyttiomyces sp. JEL0837]
MDFQFHDLSLKLSNGKSVLQGVTGEIKAGRLTCVMGPSGAGKTTFMNVLMGKVNRTGGELKINGVVAEMPNFRKIIGYVPQEDIMLRELTVREILLYSARIRLPSSWNTKEVEELVDIVLKALNLSHVAHTQIGDELTRGVSGGQRKRVNIGMELVATPLAMFLDEPTSGLDATSALDVAQILKSISRLGLTIVSVIHQPRVEIFNSFDDVLMIAPGGRTAYFGPVKGAQTYFESLGYKFELSANPADILMDILSGRGVIADGKSSCMTPDEIVRAWESSHPVSHVGDDEKKKPVVEADVKESNSTTESESTSGVAAMTQIVQNRGATVFIQTIEATSRSIIQQTRLLGGLSIELFVASFAGFIMGFAVNVDEPYWGVLIQPYSRLSTSPDDWFLGLYGMLIGIAIALAGAPSAVKVFGEEKPVFWREAASGHNKLAYYVGKTISVIPRIALASAHYTGIYYILARPIFSVGIQFGLVFLNFFAT